jgi:hypothetical protein
MALPDDDVSRSIPNAVRRGIGADPADRAPPRGAVSGLGPGGERVIRWPDGSVVAEEGEAPSAIPKGAPDRAGPEPPGE